MLYSTAEQEVLLMLVCFSLLGLCPLSVFYLLCVQGTCTIASLEVLDNLVLCSALPVVCCSLVFPHLCAKPKIA